MTKAKAVYNQLVEGTEGLTVFVKDNPITKDTEGYKVNTWQILEGVYQEPAFGKVMGLKPVLTLKESELLDYLEKVYHPIEPFTSYDVIE